MHVVEFLLLLAVAAVAEADRRDCRLNEIYANMTRRLEVTPSLNVTYAHDDWTYVEKLAVTASNLLSTLTIDRPPANIENDMVYHVHVMRAVLQGADRVHGAKLVFDPAESLARKSSVGFAMDGTHGFIYLLGKPDLDRLIRPRVRFVDGSAETQRFFAPTRASTLTLRYNASMIAGPARRVTRALVERKHGHWTFPYFDTMVAQRWIVSFVVPFLKEENGVYRRQGDVYLDMHIEDFGVNQCGVNIHNVSLNDSHTDYDNQDPFHNSHLCDDVTTTCQPTGRGRFILGEYECRCKPGYYRQPNATFRLQGFLGETLENEYNRLCTNDSGANRSEIFRGKMFQCVKCKPGCVTCDSDRECLFERNFHLRNGILAFGCVTMTIPLLLIAFVVYNRNLKIIRSASFPLLILILIAVEINLSNVVVNYFEPIKALCILTNWIEHASFVLLYGTLFLRVYRIVLIFTTQLASMNTIGSKTQTKDLLVKLVVMIAIISLYLVIWTAARPPNVRDAYTGGDDDLRFVTCESTWLNFAVGVAYVCLLAWGAWLGFKVRKVPSTYNESKLIFLLVYVVVVLYVLYAALIVFSPFRSNPDHSYVLDFVFIELRNLSVLFFLFANKVWATIRGDGDQKVLFNTRSLTVDKNPDRKTSDSGTGRLTARASINQSGKLMMMGPRNSRGSNSSASSIRKLVT